MTQEFSNRRPSILFDEECYDKWKWLVTRAPGEISVLADVTLEAGAVFRINDIFLLEQTNGRSSTEMDETAVALFLTKKQQEGYDISRLRGHLHSHADFDVFWSGTDEANIVRYAGSSPWLLSMVFNKRWDMRSRLDIFTPVHVHLNDVPYTVDKVEVEDPRHAVWEAEYKDKTKRVSWPMQTVSEEKEKHKRDNGKFGEELFGKSALKDYDELSDALLKIQGQKRELRKKYEAEREAVTSGGYSDAPLYNKFTEEYAELHKQEESFQKKIDAFWTGQSGMFD